MPSRAASSSNFGDCQESAELSHEEMRAFTHALTAARGQFAHVTKALCSEFGLGPRGPWIIGLVGRSGLAPHELATFYNVGRSLITAELNKLVEAGLLLQTREQRDGRRVTLSLTSAGRAVYDRLETDFHVFLSSRLAGYSREDVALCTRLLGDFAQGTALIS